MTQHEKLPDDEQAQHTDQPAELHTDGQASASEQNDLWAELEIEPGEVPGIKSALLRYRIMAWVVGILLVVLVCVGMPLKYVWGDNTVVRLTGVPHGWLYAVLLITAYDLSRRVGWSIKWVLAIMAAGTVPFLSFVAEHFATKDVRRRLARVKGA